MTTISIATTTSATVQSVSRAGGRLDPTAVAEAQQRDNTATRAFTAASIKASCLWTLLASVLTLLDSIRLRLVNASPLTPMRAISDKT